MRTSNVEGTRLRQEAVAIRWEPDRSARATRQSGFPPARDSPGPGLTMSEPGRRPGKAVGREAEEKVFDVQEPYDHYICKERGDAIMNSYHVARKAGVCRTIVSYVYNGKGDHYGVAKATQDRVRAAIRETGYTPNHFVRDMFLKRREAVAVGGVGGAPEKVAAVVNPALARAGYPVQVLTLAADPATAMAQISRALNSGSVVVLAPPTVPASAWTHR